MSKDKIRLKFSYTCAHPEALSLVEQVAQAIRAEYSIEVDPMAPDWTTPFHGVRSTKGLFGSLSCKPGRDLEIAIQLPFLLWPLRDRIEAGIAEKVTRLGQFARRP
jgi:hypothetical protein